VHANQSSCLPPPVSMFLVNFSLPLKSMDTKEPRSHCYKNDLRDTTQTITEAGTKCNRLLKYLRIFEGGYFIYEGGLHCPSRGMDLWRRMFYLLKQSDFARLLKFIYGGRPIKRCTSESGGNFRRGPPLLMGVKTNRPIFEPRIPRLYKHPS